MNIKLIFRKNNSLPLKTRKIEIGFVEDGILIGNLMPLEKFMGISKDFKIHPSGITSERIRQELSFKNYHLQSAEWYIIYYSNDIDGFKWEEIHDKPGINFLLFKSNYLPNTFQNSR